MANFKDHFSGHASDYAAHRPVYPAELFAFLTSIAPATNSTWDCATGSGQAAIALADHFAKVIATDASGEQVAQGKAHPHISYRVAPAEASGLPDASQDLITVAQAFHWFDFESFFQEARRVLVPNGILAVWCYGLTRVSPEVDTLIDQFYDDEIGPFWPPERRYVESGYADIDFPFEPVATPEFTMQLEWTAEHMLAYLSTWSAVKKFIAEHGRDPLSDLEEPLRRAWGEGSRNVTWPITVIARRR